MKFTNCDSNITGLLPVLMDHRIKERKKFSFES